MKRLRIFMLFSICAAFLFSSTTLFAQKKSIKGSGNVIQEDRQVADFHSIDFDGVFNVELTQGNSQKVTVEADDNIVERIETFVEDGTLILRFKKKTNIKKSKKLRVYITYTELRSLDIDGVGNVTMTNTLRSSGDLYVDFDGVGNLELNAECKNLKIDADAVGNLTMSGAADHVEMNNDGIGSVKAYDFIAASMTLKNSGIGSVKVNVTGNMDVESSGIGSVKIKGDPTIHNMNVSGMGKVKKID